MELKYKWWILLKTYEIDGKKHNRGLMKYHTSKRPIMNPDWRIATKREVETMKRTKSGINYNHNIDQ